MNTSSLLLKKIEIGMLATLFVIHALFYNFIGEVASLRSIDYSPYIASHLDGLIPIMLLFGPLYLFIWVYPLCVLVYFCFKKKYDCAFYRKIYLGFLGMMIISYIFWLCFPTHVNSRISSEFLAASGQLGSFTETIYQNTSFWNGFPSFHIAVVWYVYRINQLFFNRLNWIFLTFALLTMISVMAIRIHYFFDIFGGIILTELVIWLIIKPLNRSRWIEKGSSLTWIIIYLSVFAVFMVLRFNVMDNLTHII